MSGEMSFGKQHHPHHHQPSRCCEPAVCRLSVILFLLSALLLWGSLTISRGSEKLAQQYGETSQLLPGFNLMERMQSHSQQQPGSQSDAAGSGAAAAAEQQLGEQVLDQQRDEQQRLLLQGPPGGAAGAAASDVPGLHGPPYILPKLIHQTVKDKQSMSCEVQDSIQSWIDMNPGFTHILYDDADLLDFVKEHYPQLVDVYQGLPSNIERTDTWRYLVLHKLGGVYADSDVKCMQSIATWNQENNFDAALIVGIAKRNMSSGDTKEFNQFVMAAMPGHPVLATMPVVIAGNLAHSHLKGLPLKGHGKRVDEGILMRTGPKAFTSALEAYAHRAGAKWPVNSTQADQQGGVLFGSVRAMPKFVLGTGWDTLDHNMTCEEVKQKIRPEALICHQFFGTWKTKPEKALQARTFTYGDCQRKQQQQHKKDADAGDDVEIDNAAEEADGDGEAADGSTAADTGPAAADGGAQHGRALLQNQQPPLPAARASIGKRSGPAAGKP